MAVDDFKHLLETQFLPFVQKPMQYLGNELNIIRKDLSAVSLHGVLCFPETYDIGMSHYGGQILYHIVNSRPSWALSRCYHPCADAEKVMREKGIPLYCLEYLAPVKNAAWLEVNSGGSFLRIAPTAGSRLNSLSRNPRTCLRSQPCGWRNAV